MNFNSLLCSENLILSETQGLYKIKGIPPPPRFEKLLLYEAGSL